MDENRKYLIPGRYYPAKPVSELFSGEILETVNTLKQFPFFKKELERCNIKCERKGSEKMLCLQFCMSSYFNLCCDVRIMEKLWSDSVARTHSYARQMALNYLHGRVNKAKEEFKMVTANLIFTTIQSPAC